MIKIRSQGYFNLMFPSLCVGLFLLVGIMAGYHAGKRDADTYYHAHPEVVVPHCLVFETFPNPEK